MNHKSLLIAAALAGVSLTPVAFAYSSKDTADSTPIPRIVPSSVVNPRVVPPRFIGETVHVAFRLDQNGQPWDIEVLEVNDPRLKTRLVEAFRQWRFDMRAVGKDAAPKRFIQPIHLVPET